MSDASNLLAGEAMPELMTTGKVAVLFRRTTRTIRNWVRAGHLHTVRIGGAVLFRRLEVDQIIGLEGEMATDFSAEEVAERFPA